MANRQSASTIAFAEKMRALCRHIEAHVATQADKTLNLAALGLHAGMSPHHLQRTFKAVIGVTPREYAEACRLKVLKGALRAAPSVTKPYTTPALARAAAFMNAPARISA